ncbi:hypothetical protein [Pseudomonas sp. Pseu.R1]
MNTRFGVGAILVGAALVLDQQIMVLREPTSITRRTFWSDAGSRG